MAHPMDDPKASRWAFTFEIQGEEFAYEIALVELADELVVMWSQLAFPLQKFHGKATRGPRARGSRSDERLWAELVPTFDPDELLGPVRRPPSSGEENGGRPGPARGGDRSVPRPLAVPAPAPPGGGSGHLTSLARDLPERRRGPNYVASSRELLPQGGYSSMRGSGKVGEPAAPAPGRRCMTAPIPSLEARVAGRCPDLATRLEGTPTLNVGGKCGRPGMLLDDRLGKWCKQPPTSVAQAPPTAAGGGGGGGGGRKPLPRKRSRDDCPGIACEAGDSKPIWGGQGAVSARSVGQDGHRVPEPRRCQIPLTTVVNGTRRPRAPTRLFSATALA